MKTLLKVEYVRGKSYLNEENPENFVYFSILFNSFKKSKM